MEHNEALLTLPQTQPKPSLWTPECVWRGAVGAVWVQLLPQVTVELCRTKFRPITYSEVYTEPNWLGQVRLPRDSWLALAGTP